MDGHYHKFEKIVHFGFLHVKTKQIWFSEKKVDEHSWPQPIFSQIQKKNLFHLNSPPLIFEPSAVPARLTPHAPRRRRDGLCLISLTLFPMYVD